MPAKKKQKQKQKKQGISPIIKARTLLSSGDMPGALAVLREGAEKGNVMSCYDAGYMMIQGIGCKEDWGAGLDLIKKGRELEKQRKDSEWKSDGSATDAFGSHSMNLKSLF